MAALTLLALQLLPQMCATSFFANDPRLQRPWWTMANVQPVSAGQYSDPITLLILMETGDLLERGHGC